MSLVTMLAINKKLIWFFIIVSFIGFADATYLTIGYYQGVVPPCLAEGCDTVTTSEYATLGGISVALMGAVYYLLVCLAALLYLIEDWQPGRSILRVLPVLGFVGSLYFLYLQGFVIGAWCQYCIVSAVISTFLFVASFWLLAPRNSRGARLSSTGSESPS